MFDIECTTIPIVKSSFVYGLVVIDIKKCSNTNSDIERRIENKRSVWNEADNKFNYLSSEYSKTNL